MSEEASGGMADDIKDEPAGAGEGPEGGMADEGGKDPTGGMADEPAAGDEGKTAAQAEGENKGEPEAYELTVPEDFPLPEDNLKSFSAACREAGLSKEQAEKILDWHQEQYRQTRAFSEQEEQRILDGWNREILEDREFGGRNYKATVADARRALQAFDPDGELRAFLRESQYQFHPTVIRAVARVGRAMGEHGLAGGDGEGREPRPLEERMYPNMKF